MISSSFGGRSGLDGRRRRRAIQNGVEDDCRSVAAERQRAGRHLVEHDAERNRSVRASSSLPGLLRRHVSDRAHGGAGAGQIFEVTRSSGLSVSGGRRKGQLLGLSLSPGRNPGSWRGRAR